MTPKLSQAVKETEIIERKKFAFQFCGLLGFSRLHFISQSEKKGREKVTIFRRKKLFERKIINSEVRVFQPFPDFAHDAQNRLQSSWCLGNRCVGCQRGWKAKDGRFEFRCPLSNIFRY